MKHKCQHCDLRFSSDQIKIHLKKGCKTLNKSILCQLCGHQAKSSLLLKKHLDISHFKEQLEDLVLENESSDWYVH